MLINIEFSGEIHLYYHKQFHHDYLTKPFSRSEKNEVSEKVEKVFLNLLLTSEEITVSSSSESSKSKFLDLSVFIFLNIRDSPKTDPSSLAFALLTLFLNSSWKSWFIRIQCEDLLRNRLGLWITSSVSWSQRWDFASLKVILSFTLFRSWLTKLFAWGLYLDHLEYENLNSPFRMFVTVSEWYSDSKGVYPAISLKIVIPRAQRSIFSSYPPPK